MVSHEIILSGVIRSAVAFDDVLLRQVQILKKFFGLLNRKEFTFFRRSLTNVPDALVLSQSAGERVLLVADGAAFGAEMERVYTFYNLNPGKITLYLPESFEWLLLQSEVLGDKTPSEILSNPSEHIDSQNFFSWEQFFTHLLMELTRDTYMQYSKHHLNEFYLQSTNVARVLEAMKEK